MLSSVCFINNHRLLLRHTTKTLSLSPSLSLSYGLSLFFGVVLMREEAVVVRTLLTGWTAGIWRGQAGHHKTPLSALAKLLHPTERKSIPSYHRHIFPSPSPFFLVFLTSVLSTNTHKTFKRCCYWAPLYWVYAPPYLMRSFLKAMWLTLWSECVFLNAVCMEPECFIFSCSLWLSLANIYTTVLCTKVEFKYILSWTQNFCFLRSCFDVYSLVLNETNANLLFGVTIGPLGYTCCHGDLQPAKKRG